MKRAFLTGALLAVMLWLLAVAYDRGREDGSGLRQSCPQVTTPTPLPPLRRPQVQGYTLPDDLREGNFFPKQTYIY